MGRRVIIFAGWYKSWPGKSAQPDKWIFRLTAAIVAANRESKWESEFDLTADTAAIESKMALD